MADLNITDFNEQMDELRRTMGTLSRTTKTTNDNQKIFLKTLSDGAQTVTGFAFSVAQGSGKFQNFNSVIDFSTRTLSTFASKIPIIGGFFQAAADAVGAAAKEVTRVMDELDGTFTEFSRVGALTAQGIEGIRDQFAQSGQSLKSFRQTVLDNSISFARLGGMVSRGSDMFFKSVGELANPARSAGDNLRRLGFSTDDIVETGAAYMRQQILLGRTEQLNQRTLTTGTTELATEMDKLSKITGAQRKQLQEQREAALREGVFGAAMREMEAEGRGDQVKAIQSVNAALENLVSPQVARGFRDLAAGFPSSDEAKKLIQSTGGTAQAVLEDLKSGRIGDLEAINRLREAAKGLNVNVQQFAKVGGDAAGVYFSAYEQQLLSSLPKDATELEAKLNEERKRQQDAQKNTTNQFIEAGKQFEILNRQMNLISFVAIPSMSTAIGAFTKFVNDAITFSAGVFGMTPGELGLGTSQLAGGGVTPARGGGGGGGGGSRGIVGGGGNFGAAAAIQNTPQFRAALAGGQTAAQAYEDARRASGVGPLATPAANKASVTAILDLIGTAESGNKYDAIYPGQTYSGLDRMTVAEVQGIQNQRLAEGHASNAVGKYQILSGTLNDLISSGVLRPQDIFDKNTQDRAAIALLERRGLSGYQSGGLSGKQFADRLAQEFAGLPLENGQSFYQGPLNKATVSREKVIDLLGARYGGVMSGPVRGYQTTLHGTEAVIPLSGGRGIPIEMPAFTENLRRLADIMLDQTGRFDELLDMMRINNNLNKDLVRLQRA